MKTLQEIYDESKRIVFFGGAGVSTESGIKDFRSVDGLYNMKYDYPPEEILSRTFFYAHTEEFYRFYRDKLLMVDASVPPKPNAAHIALAKMEAKGKLSAIITQNIDGLHQEAGSRHVLELHGSVKRNYCTRCHRFYPESAMEGEGLPTCESCGGLIKPDVVLYEESLDSGILEESINEIENCDTLIVGGTSLVVYPAAGLIRYFRGQHLVLINRDPTQADSWADLVIHDSIGKVLGALNI